MLAEIDATTFLIGNGSIGLFLIVGIFVILKYSPSWMSSKAKAAAEESKQRFEESQLQIKSRSDDQDKLFHLMSEQMEANRVEARKDRQSQEERSEKALEAFSAALQNSIVGCDKRTERLAAEFSAALREQTSVIKAELAYIRNGRPMMEKLPSERG